MIVNPLNAGWEIMYHRAHAQLAAQIADYWRHTARPPRMTETVIAIACHDDLEREWEGNHLSEQGLPLDFTLNTGGDTKPLQALIYNTQYRGRWITLLTSMHLSFLLAPHRTDAKAMGAFLDEQAALQKQLRKELKVDAKEVEYAYALMQWCDRLSLILCSQELPTRERALEISLGPDGVRYDVRQRDNNDVTVEPWPFEVDAFTLTIEATHLTQPTFRDNDALVAALRNTAPTLLSWELRR